MSRRLLFQVAGRYPRQILLTVGLGFSGAIFNGVGTALIVPVLLGWLGQPIGVGGMPPILQRLLGLAGGGQPERQLLGMTVAIVLLIGLKNGAMYASTLVAGRLKQSLVNDLREEGLRLLLAVDLDFFARTSTGDLLNRLNVEVGRTAVAITTMVRSLTTIITILVFVGLLLALSWQLTLVATLLLGLVTLANQMSIVRARVFGERLSEASKLYSINLLDVLMGMRLVRAAANEQAEYERLRQLVRDREEAEYWSLASSAAIAPVSEVTGVIALILIVLVGRVFLSQQLEAVSAVLLTYLLLIFRILPLISQLNGARNQFANAVPSVEVSHDFLRRDNKPLMQNGTLPYASIQQGIQFAGVSFAYPGQSNLVLQAVDLELPKGTTLAVVGASGAGKSTLADLLPRFYDPTEGAILLDGRDLREFDLRSLRRAMGIISQDTFLFNASVRDNIAYGQPDATDQAVMAAAKLANAWEFIERLPQGFETEIGDRGILLSGGQRQRLAIARALLQNPEILILDEATSALDTVSERLVQEAIERLSRDRTTLVIAHRLSTVQRAEQIVVLDRGQVVERGTHEDLLKRGGYYAHLCAMQFTDTAVEQTRSRLAQSSYEIRNRLNATIGSLKLMLDGVVSEPEERDELTQEAYYSTLRVLKSLESLERPEFEEEVG